MNGPSIGIKASELVKQLEKLIRIHGDREVSAGGGDYPEGVSGVHLQTRSNDPYIPQGNFYIR